MSGAFPCMDDDGDIDEMVASRYGVPKHTARLGRLLLASLRSNLDVIELQSAATLRALLAFTLEHEPELPPARAGVRAAIRQFTEEAMRRAEDRERALIKPEEPKTLTR